MRYSGEAKFIVGVIVGSVLVIAFALMFVFRPLESWTKDDILPQGTVTKGKSDAKVYLVEFSDFQCPACQAFQPVVDTLVEKYKDKIIFGYRHFPLPQHPYAFKAAEAAEAAGEQGKFWEMYQYLFTNQSKISDEFIEKAAEAIGIDKQQFQKVLNEEKYRKKIVRDIEDGKRFGVRATPTFFLNGKELRLNAYEDLEKEIENELSKL